jgi:hypothetical protein
MATTLKEDLLKSHGATEVAAPADFGVRDADDPVYEGVVATPAENGTDDPDRAVMLLFSDNTMAPAESSPYEPTNAGDPVSPQNVSQSTGAVPYEDGILHAFPTDPPEEPVPPPPEPVVVTVTSLTNAAPTVATVSPADAALFANGDSIVVDSVPPVSGVVSGLDTVAGTFTIDGTDLSAEAAPLTGTFSGTVTLAP